MTCPRCGTTLDDSARFCGACGAPLASPKPRAGSQSPLAKTLVAGSGLSVPPPAETAAKPKAAARPQPSPEKTPPPQRAPSAAPAAVARNGDPYEGKVLNNRYVVGRKLGEGGFGAVYEGKQMSIGREVALKVLHPASTKDPKLVERFRREGQVACNLRDAHTVTTYDFDQTPDGLLYIAMELLRGRSLHEVFHAEAPLPWTRVFRILEQMCSSLGEAHQTGIVHRDLKPENIYIEDRPGQPDFVKILDFGIAKIIGGDFGDKNALQLTATGQTLGTLEYMSPEQLMGKQLDGRSDIYALGVLAYELMTGRLPFPDARGPAELIAAQLRKTPQAPSVARPDQNIPAGVDAVVLRMLAKDKEHRFKDVLELRKACVMVLNSGGTLYPTPAPGAIKPATSPRERAETTAASPRSLSPKGAPVPISVEENLKSVQGSRAWLWIVLGLLAAGVAVAIVMATK